MELLVQKILAKSRNFDAHFITSRTILYFIGIFMLNGKQLFTFFDMIAFLKSKLIHCQKDCCHKRYVIK